jgi:hypothetical protein
MAESPHRRNPQRPPHRGVKSHRTGVITVQKQIPVGRDDRGTVKTLLDAPSLTKP